MSPHKGITPKPLKTTPKQHTTTTLNPNQNPKTKIIVTRKNGAGPPPIADSRILENGFLRMGWVRSVHFRFQGRFWQVDHLLFGKVKSGSRHRVAKWMIEGQIRRLPALKVC